MGMKQIGTAVLHPGTPDEVWGYCETQDVSSEAEKKEIIDGTGETRGLLYTNVGKKKFSGSFVPLAGVDNSPAAMTETELIGEVLVFKVGDAAATLNVRIDSASFKRKKGDVPEFSIEGYYYPGISAETTPTTTPTTTP